MPDAYYRISANQSEADETLYQHGKMIVDLKKVAPTRKDMIPKFSDVRKTHRLPFKPEYKPIILMSNDLVKHTTNVASFTTGYNGDVQCQMYLKITVGAGYLDATGAASTDILANANAGWGFCRNFAAGLIKKVNFKVQGDIISEGTGAVLFLYSQWFVSANKRPALLRLWRETVVDLEIGNRVVSTATSATWAGAKPVRDLAGKNLFNWVARVPDHSIQTPMLYRPSFSIFVPLDMLSLTRSLEDSFPLAPLYALERKVEFEFNSIDPLINVSVSASYLSPAEMMGNHSVPTTGFIKSALSTAADANTASDVKWGQLPSVSNSNVELYVNYILVHRDLQRVMSMNGYGYVIHQYASEDVTVESNTSFELSYTKVVEWIGIIGRYTHNVTTTTITGSQIDYLGSYNPDPYVIPISGLANVGASDTGEFGVVGKYRMSTITGAALPALTTAQHTATETSGAAAWIDDPDADSSTVAAGYEADPFGLPVSVKPLDRIDITARGQTFYKELSWDEISSALGYHIGGKDFSSSKYNSIGLIPMTQRVTMEEFMGSYNSGYGPNLTVKWDDCAFDKNTTDYYSRVGASAAARPAGTLTFILFCANTFAAFRGTSTIRYT